MTTAQKTALIYTLYKSKKTNLEDYANTLLDQFGISSNSNQERIELINAYKNGVKRLNPNQFDNLSNMVLEKSCSEKDLVNKLNFYDIEKDYQDQIIEFLKAFKISSKSIQVHKMDDEFKGVQVATYDDFSEILKLGYTGDWVIDPKNVQPLRIQIASMKETGSYTRGYYINADIVSMEPIDYEGKTRYRIYLGNPTVVNSGNRNIKFSNNPVRYIK